MRNIVIGVRKGKSWWIWVGGTRRGRFIVKEGRFRKGVGGFGCRRRWREVGFWIIEG